MLKHQTKHTALAQLRRPFLRINLPRAEQLQNWDTLCHRPGLMMLIHQKTISNLSNNVNDGFVICDKIFLLCHSKTGESCVEAFKCTHTHWMSHQFKPEKFQTTNKKLVEVALLQQNANQTEMRPSFFVLRQFHPFVITKQHA